jgi:Ca2+-binding EF-hand superfamily protein
MKKNDYITSFVFVAALVQVCVSLSARADNQLIESLDLDRDGQITIKEAVANPAILASFGKIDTDGNGKISLIELTRTKITFVDNVQITKSD